MPKSDGGQRRVIERKVISMGTTLYVCIPKEFAQKHDVVAGDKILLIINPSNLRLVPLEKS